MVTFSVSVALIASGAAVPSWRMIGGDVANVRMKFQGHFCEVACQGSIRRNGRLTHRLVGLRNSASSRRSNSMTASGELKRRLGPSFVSHWRLMNVGKEELQM